MKPGNARAPLVIALTGGIASGKSTVTDRFADHGVSIVDTDVIAREVVAPGSPLLDAITRRFGADILDSSGNLRRARLRRIVFEAPEEREWLERLLHPEILRRTADQVRAARGPYCLVVIPLLAETGVPPDVDRVLVVDTTEDLQLRRLTKRDDIDLPAARSMLGSQATREERLSIADDVIPNLGTLAELLARVDTQHAEYLELAGAGSRSETGPAAAGSAGSGSDPDAADQ